jgi:hypothetical protein
VNNIHDVVLLLLHLLRPEQILIISLADNVIQQ